MRLRLLTASAVITALLLPGGIAAADPGPSETTSGLADIDAGVITLITGDQVMLRPDGLAQIAPAPGRQDMGFESMTSPDGSADLLIVPSDAMGPLSTGALDERLFNISALVRQGHVDAAELRLRVQDTDGARSLRVPAADSPQYWEELVADSVFGAAQPAEKIWLDDATDRDESLPDDDEALAEPSADDGDQQVTVTITKPDGTVPDQAQVNVQNVDTRKVYYLRSNGDGIATGAVPPGRYTALAHQRSLATEPGEAGVVATTFHEMTVEDRELEWQVGAGDLQPLEFAVDRSDARLHSIEMKLQANVPGTGSGMSFTSIQSGQWDYYSAPTGEADAYFSVRPTLTGAADANGHSDYTYHLVFATDNGVPDELSFDVDDAELAKVTAKYTHRGNELSILRNSYGKVSTGHDSGYVIPTEHVSAPGTRTEYYTADERVEWFQLGEFGDERTPDWLVRYGGRYSPGKSHVEWGDSPVGPGLIPERFPYSMNRRNDRINGSIPMFSGADANEAVWSRSGTTGSAVLTRDGVELGRNEVKPETLNFPLPADDSGEYTLTVDSQRSVPWSDLGTRGSAEWIFHSGPGDERVPLDLSVVAMRATGVVNGYASSRLPQLITLDVQRQGVDAQTTKLTFEVSHDDGETWRRLPVARDGDLAVTAVAHPFGAEFVSVRMSAADDAGNTVTHTTIRSYGLK